MKTEQDKEGGGKWRANIWENMGSAADLASFSSYE
jgi:hypothetical protein